MRSVRVVLSVALFISATQFLQSKTATAAPSSHPAVSAYNQLPIYFEPNRGQTDAQTRFVARGKGYTLFLTPSEAVLDLHSADQTKPEASALGMRLSSANPSPAIAGRELLPGYSNYLIGQDPSKWQTRIPHYAKVEYRDVYPGVNLLYYGQQHQLEYDFVVSPGADPNAIAFTIESSGRLSLNSQGNLVVQLPGGAVELQKPRLYQQVQGERHEVAGGYLMQADGSVRFTIGAYDSQLPLVIDPALNYSTYLGGSDNEVATGIAVDSTGSAYVVGKTASIDFPTANAFQGTQKGSNAFLTKLAADGKSVVFSTYLGGSDVVCGGDRANAVALNSLNEPFVAGRTFSLDFPVSAGAYQTTGSGCANGTAGGSGFVTHFTADGTALVWSTYFGGLVATKATNVLGIAVSATSNNAYITGFDSTGTLGTSGAFQSTLDAAGDQGAFVAKIAVNGGGLLYCTYIRALTSGAIAGNAIALDRLGNAYITGMTQSNNFPVTARPFQKFFGGGQSDAFITKVNTTGAALAFSSYAGGSDTTTLEYGSAIAVDFKFIPYFVGNTGSTNFPVTPGVFQHNYPGGPSNAFAMRLASDGSHIFYSTYLGGSNGSTATGIALNTGCASPCIALVYGSTNSTDFPTLNSLQTTGDLFLTTLDGAGSFIPGYSTLFGSASGDSSGQVAADAHLNAFITGTTTSSSFPVTTGAFQPTFGGGGSDGFASKLGLTADLSVAQTASPNPVPSGSNLTYTITITNNGPDAALNLTLSDNILAGTSFVSATPGNGGFCVNPPGPTGTLHCSLVNLPSGSTWVTTVVVNVNAGSGTIIKNRAAVTELVVDPVASNNSKQVSVTVQ